MTSSAKLVLLAENQLWLEWLVVAGLVIWFAGTVVFQPHVAWLDRLVERFDVFRLLVGWRLFSGLPRDLRLVYRDQDVEGRVGPWQEIPLWRSNCWHRAVWNPELVATDVVQTFAERLAEGCEKLPREKLLKMTPARAMWVCVRHAPWPGETVRRQFELREFSLAAPSEVKVLLTSDFWPASHNPLAA